MDQFYSNGDFVQGSYQTRNKKGSIEEKRREKERLSFVEIPVELKSFREFGDVFCWGAPIWVGVLAYKLINWWR